MRLPHPKLGTHSLGPERGKAIIDVSSLDRSKGKPTEASLGRRTRVTEADLTIAALHPILRDAEEMKVRVQGMVSTPWIESTVMPSRAFGSTGDPADFQKSMDDPRWASFLGKTPASDYAALPVSAVLKGASGRYRPGAGAKSGRVRLRLLPARSYDDLLAPGEGGLSQDMLVVVCCLASWLPQSNRAEAWLETLNGELAAERAGSNGAPPPFVLAKFDMSQSRLLRDRYNINTLPMYLMYYNGRLAYASNVLNGFGTGKEDMRAQVRASVHCRRAVLPTSRAPGTLLVLHWAWGGSPCSYLACALPLRAVRSSATGCKDDGARAGRPFPARWLPLWQHGQRPHG